MDLRAVQNLASQGEGQKLEFKKKANHPEKIMKELVAFANSEGGKLLLGVDDDGTANGVRAIEGELFLIEDAIEKRIRPKLKYATALIKVNEKKGIAVIQIPPFQGKLFYVREEVGKKMGTAYIRRNDESLQASKEMREIIERRHKGKDMQFTFDEKVKAVMHFCERHGGITIMDLVNEAKISKFIASRVLVRLVLANVLDIQPSPKQDLYILKNKS